MNTTLRLASLFVIVIAGMAEGASIAHVRSHPSMRPLPQAAKRFLVASPAFFVDALKGDDSHDGTQERPWRTLQHSVGQLKAGDTLYLRAGTYYEHVMVANSGSVEKPITICAFPEELAIVDGGIREFFESPRTAWEPCEGGAKGEFRSAKSYPNLGGKSESTNVLGNFGDSMVPLQGYHFLNDLRSDNPYWNVKSKSGASDAVYCGPGVYYDVDSGRIHVRLAHTALSGLGEDNYRGETDPRELPLVIAGHAGGAVISLRDVQHVRLKNLVLRGAREATLEIRDCADIELEGLTVYGGSAPIQVRDTAGLRMHHTACRGIAAPWTFRGSLKYRAIESRLFSASGWSPSGVDNSDFEIAYCEFTDSVDGVFIGNVRRVRFHHNLLDNVSDDGIFLTSATAYDGTTWGGDVQIYQNLFSRCLTVFAFGVGHGRQRTIADGMKQEGAKQLGSGVSIFRNIFDFRRPVHYHWPSGPDAPQEITTLGRFAGDHGSPGWEPMRIYHNTFLVDSPDRGEYGAFGITHGMGLGTSRRVFNNIFYTLRGRPGTILPSPAVDFQADGNLHWSLTDGDQFADIDAVFSKFRNSPVYELSKQRYTPGWTAHDRWSDPQFERVSADWHQSNDLRLKPSSPAVNAGVPISAKWPDTLRAADRAAPDVGAIPLENGPWPVAVGGRLTVFGEPSMVQAPIVKEWAYSEDHRETKTLRSGKSALVYCGYPAFDAPLLEFAFRKQGTRVEKVERTWLAPSEFKKYDVVAIDGSFLRAKIEPNKFSSDELNDVKQYLENGGTLLLMRERMDLFNTPEGQDFIFKLVGQSPPEKNVQLAIRQPEHPWVRTLKDSAALESMTAKNAVVRRTSRGENILGSREGATILYSVPVGMGRLIYLGWSIANAMPEGRRPSTVEQEKSFVDQMGVLLNIAGDVVSRKR